MQTYPWAVHFRYCCNHQLPASGSIQALLDHDTSPVILIPRESHHGRVRGRRPYGLDRDKQEGRRRRSWDGILRSTAHVERRDNQGASRRGDHSRGGALRDGNEDAAGSGSEDLYDKLQDDAYFLETGSFRPDGSTRRLEEEGKDCSLDVRANRSTRLPLSGTPNPLDSVPARTHHHLDSNLQDWTLPLSEKGWCSTKLATVGSLHRRECHPLKVTAVHRLVDPSLHWCPANRMDGTPVAI